MAVGFVNKQFNSSNLYHIIKSHWFTPLGLSVFMTKITQKGPKRLTYNDVPDQIFLWEYQNIPIKNNGLYVDVRGNSQYSVHLSTILELLYCGTFGVFLAIFVMGIYRHTKLLFFDGGNPQKIHFLTFFLQNYYKNDILTTVLYTPMCVYFNNNIL